MSRVTNAFLSYKNGDTGFYKACVSRWALSDLYRLKMALLAFDVEGVRHELYSLDTEPLKRFCRDIEQRYTPLYDEEIFGTNNRELCSLLTETHGKGSEAMMHNLNEIAHINNIIVGDVCSIIDELQPQRQAPQEPSTERAKKAFKLALEAGYLEETDTGYRWLYLNGRRGSDTSLGYFLLKVYDPDNTSEIPMTALQGLFGVKRLDRATSRAINVQKPQRWRAAIDELLKEI